MSNKMTRVVSATFIMVLLVACAPAAPAADDSAAAAPSGYGTTLSATQDRGTVLCGSAYSVPGFGVVAEDGSHVGYDVEYCRAISAAIFGEADNIEFHDLSSKVRFTALGSGEVDVLSRTTTWTLTRDTELATNFVHTTFYDGQGMMVRKDSGLSTLEDLDGASICVTTGTTTELNLADQFAAGGLDYEPILFEEADDTWGAYEEGRCDGVTTDKSGLNGRRTLLQNPKDHIIMEVTMSKEPLGPVVRHGDDQWFDIVQWTVFAMMQAEEFGITSSNVDTFKGSENPNIRKLLGEEGEMGQKLGLNDDWAYNIIKLVGNMGEAYDQHLGPNTPTAIPRGLNRLYTDGGLMYPPPVR
ncbi:MAG: amino acid ABC transporter substrate-binding protein [Spirochaetales bacterium]|nr:amino acid ABC transporter substrate-binding protein [Spirochaetales bacterium]